ncbi:MAG TPA: hypothetical protein VHH73_08330 [Verrucomicrobiae bacterium]|nr:hypothetical protein [Verrucomicrobiae bacterium]
MDDPILVTALVLFWAVFFDKPKAIWKIALADFPRIGDGATPAFRLEPMFFKPGVAIGRTRVPLPSRAPLVAVAPPAPAPVKPVHKPRFKTAPGQKPRDTQPPSSPFSHN